MARFTKGRSLPAYIIEDRKIRKANHKEIVIRRSDGMKVCPVRTCEGFGYDINLEVEI